MKEDQNAYINETEYEVLFNWYTEWVKICKLLATFSFTSIGFVIIIFDLKSGKELDPEQLELIQTSWGWLGLGGLLAGFSITLAYIWLDSFSRGRAPSLIGKVVFKGTTRIFLKVGIIGWLVTIAAAISVLIGLYYVISATTVLL